MHRPVTIWKNTWQVISTAKSSEVIALQLTLCVVFLLTAVIGNGAVCFLVMHFKAFRTVPLNIILANLACMELLNNLVNVPLYMVYDIGNEKSVITSTAAWWMTFLAILFALLSLASMFFLVTDRYLAIVYTMKYYVWKSPRKALVAAMTAWISALVAVGVAQCCSAVWRWVGRKVTILLLNYLCYKNKLYLLHITDICNSGNFDYDNHKFEIAKNMEN